MNIVCIIQARTGSTRLPNKIFFPLQGKPILLRVIDRVLESKSFENIVVATSTKPNDQKIIDLVRGYHPRVATFIGSEEDLLDRYYQAAKEAKADIVVRITSDNPFIDPEVIDKAVKLFRSEPGLQYVSNNIGTHTYPRGLDTEVVAFSTLETLWRNTTEFIDRENVTIHIKRFPEQFKWKSLQNDIDLSSYRWTVDEEADYRFAEAVYDAIFPVNPHFRMKDIIAFLEENPNIRNINAHVEQKNAKY